MRAPARLASLLVAAALVAAARASAQSLPATAWRTSPPSRDTVGYWQQRADYRIVATLDEQRGLLDATGTLRYVNRSPDTLRELRVHQYLNAFRPGSRWSATDEREGRVRFQRLPSDAIGFERFTAPPSVGGAPLTVTYPFAPDSTVAHLALPRPLAPGDSIDVTFAWTARPSALPRRQGRRDRDWDFAHWYPRVAPYDRGGWQDNPLVPAGEFYGEFGSFDVTLVVRDDQVLGATGVPVEGDPGWSRQAGPAPGAVVLQREAYDVPGPGPAVAVPAGHRRVRWLARDVHHFAWSASPNYRHEGAAWVRPRPVDTTTIGFRTWDTVAVHVLWKPGDEAEWGNGQAVARTIRALDWLERFYGPYAYPQITNLHRIEGGGTEFPMLFMDGSASQGLILHEFGHVFTHGILANNEWRDGWMDEGLTSFQEAWFAGALPQERAASGDAPARATGYRSRALVPPPAQRADASQIRLDLTGLAEPLSTTAHAYREFGVYSAMIYGRGQRLFEALRDVLGDETMRRFWRGYYARWALKHVDEAAMRAEAERACACDLQWFFDQWVRRTGLVDYALGKVTTDSTADGFVTRAEVRRRGDYVHAPRVGARTRDGWTLAQAQPVPGRDVQVVELRTATRPLEVRLDPFWTSGDWNPVNDTPRRWYGHAPSRATSRDVIDWPFLRQWQPRVRTTAWSVVPWYTEPGGASGALRFRMRTGELADVMDVGMGYTARRPGADAPLPLGTITRGDERGAQFPFWWTWENPTFGRSGRPIIGLRLGAWDVDGLARGEVSYRWDRSRYRLQEPARDVVTFALDAIGPNGRRWLSDGRWSGTNTVEASVTRETRPRARRVGGAELQARGRAHIAGGLTSGIQRQVLFGAIEAQPLWPNRWARAELERAWRLAPRDEAWFAAWRVWGGIQSAGVPVERGLWLSAASPAQTFANHWWRGAGAPLAREDVPFVPLGGAGLRGYSPFLPITAAGGAPSGFGLDPVAVLLAANTEVGRRLVTLRPGGSPLRLYATAWADAATRPDAGIVAEATRLASQHPRSAGLGLVARGLLWDQPVRLRLDLPLYVAGARAAAGPSAWRDRDTRFRVTFSASDLW